MTRISSITCSTPCRARREQSSDKGCAGLRQAKRLDKELMTVPSGTAGRQLKQSKGRSADITHRGMGALTLFETTSGLVISALITGQHDSLRQSTSQVQGCSNGQTAPRLWRTLRSRVKAKQDPRRARFKAEEQASTVPGERSDVRDRAEAHELAETGDLRDLGLRSRSKAAAGQLKAKPTCGRS